MISTRGRSYIEPPSPLLDGLLGWAANPFHPENNRGGVINCGTAENCLVSDLTLPVLSSQQQKMTAQELKYDMFEGSSRFKAAVGGYLEMILKVPIESERIVACAGTGSVVSFACCCIGDEGDGVIIPGPYYGAFDLDVCRLAKLQIVQANRSADDGFVLRVDALEEAYQSAIKTGVNVRALLLTSPDNPTGYVFDKETLLNIYHWAKSHSLHLLCDEIYASSVYNGHFISILQAIYEENLWEDEFTTNYVHIAYGFAKDFAMSGFRSGILYTRNPLLKEAFSSASLFASVSRQTQFGLCGLLEDKTWLREYLDEYQRRLKASFEAIVTLLTEHKIPFIPPSGGLFCVVDLRKYLKEQTWEEEMKLYNHIFSYKLYCNPGKPFAFSMPGFFRLIFSQPIDTMNEAVTRLASALETY